MWNQCFKRFVTFIYEESYEVDKSKPRFYPVPNESALEQKTKDYVVEFENSFKLKNRTLVSIDEVGFSSNTRPLKEWNRKGTRFHNRFCPSSTEKKHISCCCLIYNG